ncbi:vWA domain-containing protein [Falsiroseomonas oryziterrae]|uniref:vWA domain-containing protein n=1 Tax=Falsiroseomonas oryziterrae TaxID=2911368 RepID=UPI001F1F6672|nr:VWA domain-containing protein [Roseomonas sp. NPKOSM-4]
MIPPKAALGLPLPAGPGGALGANLIAFGRLLRRAGLPVGPSEILAGAAALECVDLGDRAQAKAALRATMVHRHEHFLLFDHAFSLFWRDPEAGRHAAAMALLDGFKEQPKPPAASRRLAEAMRGDRPEPPKPPEPQEEKLDVTFTVSDRERLQAMDFEAMSAEEIAAAKEEIRKLVLPLDARPTRRYRASHRGTHADLRLTVRESLRTGGEILDIARRRRVVRTPPLVVLCDISGSMSRYAQVLLHFIHAVTNDRDRVHAFLFGTRLSNVTRQLRHRDPEAAFEMVSHAVPDWSGGTRIGESLERFNRLWSRRVLGQGAVVLLITDGLDREGAKGLAEATERLRKSCRRLVWLNPLLRYAGFQPKSQGIRAMLPHVDEFRPVHNLASLRELVAALSDRRPGRGREFDA